MNTPTIAQLIEAANTPAVARFISGTSNWAAAMQRALLAQAAQPQAGEPVFINGLTEAETNATMSVRGLSEPQKPEIDCKQCGNRTYEGECRFKYTGNFCTNGDKFTKLPAVQLYRSGV